MLPVMDAGRSLSPLVGQRLEYVRLGHAVTLGFTGGREVLFEAVAHLDGPAGRADIEPGDNPSDALAVLLGDTVGAARTRPTGELELLFRSGCCLVIDADPDAESWAVTGPDGALMVCVSTGEVAVWVP